MKTPFQDAYGSYTLSTWDDAPSRAQALHFLQRLARTSDGVRNLRRVLWELDPSREAAELDDEDVVDLLADKLASGAIRVWETPATVPSVAVQVTEKPEPPERDEVIPERLVWIEIQLVGEDDQGIVGERYVIETPDGKVHEGRTGAEGFARLDAIPSGSCKVSFPELDETSWETI